MKCLIEDCNNVSEDNIEGYVCPKCAECIQRDTCEGCSQVEVCNQNMDSLEED